MTDTIGFIGLGVMGRPMTRNLLAAGRDVVVHTRSKAVLDEFGAAGARVAADPAGVAAQSDVIITMLPTGDIVTEVLNGERGVLMGLRSGSLVIDMSTIEPAVSRALAAQVGLLGAGMLDAPVSGGDIGAKQGTLSIMIGGDVSDVERAQPIFDILGSTITHVGPHGSGQVVKACNQLVVGITYAAVSEALVLGSKAGIDPGLILDVLNGGLAGNRIMEVRRQKLLEHEFTPGFTIDLHHKDIGIALQAGGELGVPLPFSAAVQQAMRAMRARGEGGLDHSALLLLAEAAAQHTIIST